VQSWVRGAPGVFGVSAVPFPFRADSMLGRDAQSGGHDKAARYLASEAARLGLQPAGESGSWFQTVPLGVRRLSSESRIVVPGATLRPTRDFKVFPVGHGQLRPIAGARVVFGGMVGDTARQIPAPAAAGRIVLLGVPADMTAERVYRDIVYGPTSRFGQAVAVAIASLDYLPRERRVITSLVGIANAGGPAASDQPSSILVTESAARLMLGRGLKDAVPGTLGEVIQGRLPIDERSTPTKNVVATLPGADPALRATYVALGAHSDHIGLAPIPLDHDSVRAAAITRTGLGALGGEREAARAISIDSIRRLRAQRADSVFNGADDDDSGSVALLEIANALSLSRERPRRSILFVWHGAEEAGLVGSRWFMDHPTVPRDSIAFEINLDMIGRGTNDTSGTGRRVLQLIGAGRLPRELTSC